MAGSWVKKYRYVGDNTAESVVGHQSKDFIDGSGGADTLDGSDGNDTIEAGSGSDLVLGGAGNDRLAGDPEAPGRDLINDDTVYGGLGDDWIYGGRGADLLAGQTGDDRIILDSRFYGQFGSGPIDSLIDTIDGGRGEDVLAIDLDEVVDEDFDPHQIPANVQFNINLQENNFVNIDGVVVARLVNIESLLISTISNKNQTIIGGVGDDTISVIDRWFGNLNYTDNLLGGGDGADSVSGASGDDSISGGDGDDSLYGGGGSDTISAGAGDDQVKIFREGAGQVDLGEGDDLLEVVNRTEGSAFAPGAVLHGGDGVDTLRMTAKGDVVKIGDGVFDLGQSTAVSVSGFETYEMTIEASSLSFKGGAGADSISGGAGSVFMAGEGGDDSLRGGSSGKLVLTGGAGDDSLDVVRAVESKLSGGSGNDTLSSYDSDHTSSGGAGDDLMIMNLGGEQHRFAAAGGRGQDRLNLNFTSRTGEHPDTPVVMAGDLRTGATFQFGGGSGTARDVEALSIYATNGDDFILGGVGGDLVYAYAGADTIRTGDGGDYIFDTVGENSIDAGGGDDVMVGQGVIYAGSGDDSVTGHGTIDTGDGDDEVVTELVGSDNIINLGGGVDLISIDVSEQPDPQFVSMTQVGDRTMFTLNLQTGAVVTGAERFAITTRSGDDSLFGAELADTLSGGAGANSLDGKGGDDVLSLVADELADTVSGGGGEDVLTIAGGAFKSLKMSWSQDVLTIKSSGAVIVEADGVERVEVAGSNQRDELVGFDGSDTLQGNGGFDRLFGGKGDDLLSGYGFLDGGAGNDKLDVGLVSFRLASQAKAVDVTTTLMGGTGDDVLIGSGLHEYLSGDAGADTLNGGYGNDRLTGGEGGDLLTGGAGNDRFLIETLGAGPDGADVIADFSRTTDNDDLVNFRLIDANSGTRRDDAFEFIGSQRFSGTAGELRLVQHAKQSIFYGDVDGDRIADVEVRVLGQVTPTEADIVL